MREKKLKYMPKIRGHLPKNPEWLTNRLVSRIVPELEQMIITLRLIAPLGTDKF